jgi:hypothetical protein
VDLPLNLTPQLKTVDVSQEEPGHFGHIVGPELRRVKW